MTPWKVFPILGGLEALPGRFGVGWVLVFLSLPRLLRRRVFGLKVCSMLEHTLKSRTAIARGARYVFEVIQRHLVDIVAARQYRISTLHRVGGWVGQYE